MLNPSAPSLMTPTPISSIILCPRPQFKNRKTGRSSTGWRKHLSIHFTLIKFCHITQMLPSYQFTGNVKTWSNQCLNYLRIFIQIKLIQYQFTGFGQLFFTTKDIKFFKISMQINFQQIFTASTTKICSQTASKLYLAVFHF